MGTIHTVCERTKDREVCPSVTSDRSVEDALVLLVKYELGFGGRVSSLEPDAIQTVTQVMSCYDRTTFTGKQEDMRLLVKAARIHTQIFDDALDCTIEKVYSYLMERSVPVSTFIFTQMGPMLIGQHIAEIAMLLVTELFEVKKIPSLDDLCVAAVMLQEGVSQSEIYELLN